MHGLKKQALLYGIALGALIALLKAVEYRFTVRDHALEVYGGVLAILFTGLGIWLALKLTKPKTAVVVVEKTVVRQESSFVFDEDAFNRLGISRRELEVLQLIAEGLTNQEIADKLFVSLNTIKTHSSKLFEKLEVNRRTQAIQKAKELRIIK